MSIKKQVQRQIKVKKSLQKQNHNKKLAEMLVNICGINSERLVQTIKMIKDRHVNIKINRKLPRDCRKIVEAIEVIVKWHSDGKYKTASPEILVREMSTLAALRASLSEIAAWYSLNATVSVMDRRNWKAATFSALRTFGKDLETNIKNKTTVEDIKMQAEAICSFIVEPELQFGYVAEYLQNLLSSTKGILTAIDRQLTELKYQRQTEGTLQK
jgi:hypothetical protein